MDAFAGNGEMIKPNILLVDDKVNNLIALETTLDECGANFVRALSGNDALKEMLHQDFALAILDIQMPEMDGYELAQLIRSRVGTRHLPIIFLSAVYSDNLHIFKGYDSGAVDFITKPYEAGILVNKVKVFLELYEQKIKLKQIAELYEKTFNAITDVVMIQDENMRIRQINDRGCVLLAKDKEEIVGRHCYEVFRGTSQPCPECKRNRHDNKQYTCSWEVRHGKLGINFLISASPLRHNEGGSMFTVYVARDITEQKKIKEQLLQSEKLEAIGTLAGGIAHDFNNILSAVLGYAELSLLEEHLEPALRDNLMQIKKAGDRAKELVSQILTFSRKSNRKSEPILITPVLKEALKLLRATIPKTIDIISSIKVDCERVVADPIEIHQIIMNMCTNSLQAMDDERGTIEITLLPVKVDDKMVRQQPDLHVGDYLRLTVRDSGRGMDEELLGRIFDPFFTTKEHENGTGMGLSVVHGIVTHCGGAITVQSSPGKGTGFDIFFPVVEQKAEDCSSDVEMPLVRGAGRILLVDDEENLRRLGKCFLQHLGYTPIIASSGVEALAVFKQNPNDFAAVITDQTMPGLPGNLLAREILQIRPDIPIVLCTGYSTVITEKQALEAGIKAFMIKPLSIKNFSETVAAVLGKKQEAGDNLLL